MLLAFIILTITALFFAYRFTISLKDLLIYSNNNKVDIFGKTYKSYTHLYSDFNFHNEIFSGKKLESSPDKLLNIKLKSVRSNMLFQYLFGALALLSIIINGVINA